MTTLVCLVLQHGINFLLYIANILSITLPQSVSDVVISVQFISLPNTSEPLSQYTNRPRAGRSGFDSGQGLEVLSSPSLLGRFYGQPSLLSNSRRGWSGWGV